MARPKEFDEMTALDAAIGVFRDKGYAATSASTLVDALHIGRQSLYDTFGDKWRLYLEAVRRYAAQETDAHLAALKTGPRALDGIEAMLMRVVATASETCLGVGSICEFGTTQPELTKIHEAAGLRLHSAVLERVRSAQSEGSIASVIDPEQAAQFLTANIAAIRVAARAGSRAEDLSALARLALRGLR
ncbi:TetR family transcriptional regulator [Rhizobium lusitanum]|uniref:TetR family transcriptional regulator n=1 Tax=Rhizobium lusitanum TaxID=293958 RepID=A0A6L9UFE9_9HYPH|nr:TetR/AcrR family transcriptional regulator [Rhizobium lusitanum]NEI72720.1 TetR family transcriptional regulator [Rhizobium lusitanum]